jgi:hypothetical protein
MERAKARAFQKCFRYEEPQYELATLVLVLVTNPNVRALHPPRLSL